jgi:hypothetical protein
VALRLKLILPWTFSSLGLDRTNKRRLRAQARLERGYRIASPEMLPGEGCCLT